MEWFYARNGQQVGPVSFEHLKELVSSGQVSRRDKVWREGMSDWVSAGDVPELVAGMAAPAPPPPVGATTPGYTPGWTPPASSRAPQLESYLVHSILATVMCCLPFGIIGIVFASQVNTKLAAGDYEGAKKASEAAKLWVIVSVVAYFVLFLGAFFFMVGPLFFLH